MTLTLRPSINFRPHEAPVSTPLAGNYAFTVVEDTFRNCVTDEYSSSPFDVAWTKQVFDDGSHTIPRNHLPH